MRNLRRWSLIAGLAAMAHHANAQSVDSVRIPMALRASVGSIPPIGPHLRIRAGGDFITGRSHGLSGDTIELATREGEKRIALEVIDSLWESRSLIRPVAWKFALMGVAAGALAEVPHLFWCETERCVRPRRLQLSVALGAAAGAFVGVLFGETRRDWRLLYPLAVNP
jgi:hypothetical protein